MEGNGASRNTRTILQAALQELYDREEKLQPFIAEVGDVKHGIKTLEKALDIKARKPTGQADGRAKQDNGGKDKIREALKASIDPLSLDEIGDRTGSKMGLHLRLPAMVKAGELTVVDENGDGSRYGLPVPVAAG